MRERLGAGRTSPAAQRRQMPIADAFLLERGTHRLRVELRIGARARETPDVGDEIDAGLAQQLDELARRPRGMADRMDDHGGILP